MHINKGNTPAPKQISNKERKEQCALERQESSRREQEELARLGECALSQESGQR